MVLTFSSCKTRDVDLEKQYKLSELNQKSVVKLFDSIASLRELNKNYTKVTEESAESDSYKETYTPVDNSKPMNIDGEVYENSTVVKEHKKETSKKKDSINENTALKENTVATYKKDSVGELDKKDILKTKDKKTESSGIGVWWWFIFFIIALIVLIVIYRKKIFSFFLKNLTFLK